MLLIKDLLFASDRASLCRLLEVWPITRNGGTLIHHGLILLIPLGTISTHAIAVISSTLRGSPISPTSCTYGLKPSH